MHSQRTFLPLAARLSSGDSMMAMLCSLTLSRCLCLLPECWPLGVCARPAKRAEQKYAFVHRLRTSTCVVCVSKCDGGRGLASGAASLHLTCHAHMLPFGQPADRTGNIHIWHAVFVNLEENPT